MWVMVWYGSVGGEEFVPMETPFQDLRILFPGCDRVELSGDDFQ